MTASEGALDPVCAGDDAFFDALVGVDQVCRWLARELDAAMQVGAPRDAPPELASPGRPPDGSPDRPPDGSPDGLADELPDGLPVEQIDEPLAALLGLVSVRTTISLVLAALGSEHASREPAAGASMWSPMWSREQLR